MITTKKNAIWGVYIILGAAIAVACTRPSSQKVQDKPIETMEGWTAQTVQLNDTLTAVQYLREEKEWPHNIKHILKIGDEYWYQNLIHGYMVRIPKDMAFNQIGEESFDPRGNTFFTGEDLGRSRLTIICYSTALSSDSTAESAGSFDSKSSLYTKYTYRIPFDSAKEGASALVIQITCTPDKESIAKAYIQNLKNNIILSFNPFH